METDTEVAKLYADGTLDTDDQKLREIYDEMIERGGIPVLKPLDTGDSDVHAVGEFLVEPDDDGYL